MEIRKMAGWCLILLGVVRVFQTIHLQTVKAEGVGPISVALISLLFTVGAAFLLLNKAPWRSQT